MITDFLTPDELASRAFAAVGEGVEISRRRHPHRAQRPHLGARLLE